MATVISNDVDLLIYGQIGFDVTSQLVASELIEAEGQSVRVRINSGGGSAMEGFAIYNLLKQYRGHVTVDIDGGAMSAASIVAMAGDRIRMAENALLMIHLPFSDAGGTSDEHRSQADLLDKVTDNIVNIYASRTRLGSESITEMMANETWLSASEALEAGFVDEITSETKIAASFNCTQLLKETDMTKSKSLLVPKADAVQAPEAPPKTVEPLKETVKVPENQEDEDEEDEEEDETQDAKAAATFDQLKATCHGADSDFICECLERKSTLLQASSDWMVEQQLRIEKTDKALADTSSREQVVRQKVATDATGVDALEETHSTAVANSAKRQWTDLVKACVKNGMSNQDASIFVAKEHPELRLQVIDEANIR